jgi:hypothetical protein
MEPVEGLPIFDHDSFTNWMMALAMSADLVRWFQLPFVSMVAG